MEDQQTQPTYDAESGNRTRATLVGGECSHRCAIPASPKGQGAKHLPVEVADKQGSVIHGVLLRDQRYVRRHDNQFFPRLKENRSAGVMVVLISYPDLPRSYGREIW